MDTNQIIESVCGEIYNRVFQMQAEEHDDPDCTCDPSVGGVPPCIIYCGVQKPEANDVEAMMIVPRILPGTFDSPEGELTQDQVALVLEASLAEGYKEFGKPAYVFFTTPSLKVGEVSDLAVLTSLTDEGTASTNQFLQWNILIMYAYVLDGKVMVHTREFPTVDGKGIEFTGEAYDREWDMEAMNRSVDNAKPMAVMWEFMKKEAL